MGFYIKGFLKSPGKSRARKRARQSSPKNGSKKGPAEEARAEAASRSGAGQKIKSFFRAGGGAGGGSRARGLFFWPARRRPGKPRARALFAPPFFAGRFSSRESVCAAVFTARFFPCCIRIPRSLASSSSFNSY